MKTVYFIGIGGIGMSALARYYKGRGAQVYGYDKTPSPLTDQLSAEGMNIHFSEDVSLIPQNVDLVIYTPAIPKQHKELLWFIERGFPIKKRAEVLGIISRDHPTVAVAGTHGKTTTSAILTHILHTGGVHCTSFLGGIASNFDSNFIEGNSDWVVVEADEFDRSFLQLSPNITIINSMDADHLDIYGDGNSFEAGFHEFVRRIAPDGKVFYKHDLPLKFNDQNDAWLTNCLADGSFGIDEGAVRASNVRVEHETFVFDYADKNGRIDGICFTLPGHHNVLNATAAIAVARQLGVTDVAVKAALSTFKGIQRRFEFVVRTPRHIYIDDYAHHPTELAAAIGAARTLYPTRKLAGVFQPHLYTRTRDFVDGFAAALDLLDEVFLMDIYPARELPIEGVSSDIIFNKMKLQNKQMVTKATLMNALQASDLDVLLTLGAGDIDRFVLPIRQMLLNV